MKKSLSIFLVLALMLLLPVSAAAETGSTLVHDWAELMEPDEQELLREQLRELSDRYGLYICIVTTDDLEGKDPGQYAESTYDRIFGVGTDGILFLLSMEDRDWYISTNGRGMELLDDTEVYDSFDDIKDYLADDAWYDGFAAWVDNLSYYLDYEEPEEPDEGWTWEEEWTDEEWEYPRPNLWISLAVGAGIALVVILILRAGMNTKRKQHSARQYLQSGSYHLTQQQDIFLYSNTTRTARPKDDGGSSSGGGRSSGGGHSGGGGGSRGGGGGKF